MIKCLKCGSSKNITEIDSTSACGISGQGFETVYYECKCGAKFHSCTYFNDMGIKSPLPDYIIFDGEEKTVRPHICPCCNTNTLCWDTKPNNIVDGDLTIQTECTCTECGCVFTENQHYNLYWSGTDTQIIKKKDE